MSNNQSLRIYDVALSFAGEDREYVDAVAHALRRKGLRVFYDLFEEADIAGRNLVDHLSQIYQKKARLCVVFVSHAYASKPYPRLERQSAQARAFESEEPYIIPVRLDDAEIPGLLPTVAHLSKKTPENLSHLIASKLMLTEAPGVRTDEIPTKGETVVIRFISLIEPDMETFRQTIQYFDHWAEEKLRSIPVELRIPETLENQINDAKDFRFNNSWKSDAIGDDTRKQFSDMYDKRIPKFLRDIIKGVQALVHRYTFSRSNRLEFVVRRFLMTRMTILCRILLDHRLVGMPPIKWEPMFSHFSHAWSEWVMYGLAYACFLDGDERFLWVDTDGWDTSTSIIWPQDRFRLYAPAEFLITRNHLDKLTPDQFDRFFAIQFLDLELENEPGQPLLYFAQYPDRLNLSVRGEWAVDTQHFDQHGTFNFGGKPLLESVGKLRQHVLSESNTMYTKDIERELAIHRIRDLFSEREQFDEILFPSNA